MIDRSLNYGRHLIEHFLRLAGQFQTVLDIGAGGGYDLMLAKKINSNARLLAVENHPRYAQELVNKGITVYDLDIEKNKLPFPDNSIDIVIVNQVLEHTKEIFWIFHELTRVLKVGGKLLIGVPNLASLHNRILLAFGKQPSSLKSNSAHIRGFTKGDILAFLEGCFPGGFSLKAYGGSNFYPFPPIVARPMARAFPTMAWGIFLMMEKQVSYSGGFLDYPVVNHLETNFYVG